MRERLSELIGSLEALSSAIVHPSHQTFKGRNQQVVSLLCISPEIALTRQDGRVFFAGNCPFGLTFLRSGIGLTTDSMIVFFDDEECNSWTWMFLYQEAADRVG